MLQDVQISKFMFYCNMRCIFFFIDSCIAITKSVLDSPITMRNEDTMDGIADEMEESIPDMGVDESEPAEDELVCMFGDGNMILRQRHLSAVMLQTSQALIDSGDKNHNGVGACLSS